MGLPQGFVERLDHNPEVQLKTWERQVVGIFRLFLMICFSLLVTLPPMSFVQKVKSSKATFVTYYFGTILTRAEHLTNWCMSNLTKIVMMPKVI